MIACKDNSVLPMDPRALKKACHIFRLRLDPDYLTVLPSIHGGVPVAPYFTTPNGKIRQIAWFVSFLDEDSELPEPFEPAFYYQKNDARIDDRSIPAIMNDEVCPYHDGERIVPFAALVTDGERPLTLRLYTLDSYPGDSLCFDLSTTPNSIVICSGRDATEAVVSWDEGEVDEVDYDAFIERVANSFKEFIEMLRDIP